MECGLTAKLRRKQALQEYVVKYRGKSFCKFCCVHFVFFLLWPASVVLLMACVPIPLLKNMGFLGCTFVVWVQYFQALLFIFITGF